MLRQKAFFTASKVKASIMSHFRRVLKLEIASLTPEKPFIIELVGIPPYSI